MHLVSLASVLLPSSIRPLESFLLVLPSWSRMIGMLCVMYEWKNEKAVGFLSWSSFIGHQAKAVNGGC
jgi:hypothetical protein